MQIRTDQSHLHNLLVTRQATAQLPSIVLVLFRSLDLSLFNPTQKAKLSGSLPSSWEAIVRLRILDLSNQDISGKMQYET